MFEYKKNRAIEDLKNELAIAIRKIKDPRVRDSLINIVKIEASNKLSTIKVYISTIKGFTRSKKAAEGLNFANGFIKKEIGKNLRLRYMPNFVFVPTDSIEYGTNISKKLSSLQEQ